MFIATPEDAPAPLSLYARPSWEKQHTEVFLCNSDPLPIRDIVIHVETIKLMEFRTAPDEHLWDQAQCSKLTHELLPAKSCVSIASLCHRYWDFASRYRVSYTGADGRRWRTEAYDADLNADRLAQDPTKVWVPFKTPVALA